MAGLRTLLEYSGTGQAPTNGPMTVLRIYDTSTNAVNNGGACCLWTVPANVSWIGVEVWGGGGSGPGACCNRTGRPGGAGSYGRKIFEVTAGDQWTICAGGTTNCCTGCTGAVGNGSYMCKSGACCICASGGIAGCTICLGHCNYGYCDPRSFPCGCVKGSSFNICGIYGISKWNYGNSCHYWNWSPGAPYAHTSGVHSHHGCVNCHGNWHGGNCTLFPGSGGMNANNRSSSTRWCGQKGAGGLVEILYVSEQA